MNSIKCKNLYRTTCKSMLMTSFNVSSENMGKSRSPLYPALASENARAKGVGMQGAGSRNNTFSNFKFGLKKSSEKVLLTRRNTCTILLS